ncbi:hypothetical protein [Azonexus sp.]|jgi:hypothetical protein|uniref:hypothetical protein n=1 Tax=Azonexus sp. TaxID=1872668 RepID=UPI002839E056|nr:hypothetical protein [Azonexus sp.]MDR1994637.1 hypothetical protein [Azonexus sp.]
MSCFDHAADAFGDPFALDNLPLPRPAAGYAVQMLGSDRLLDRRSGAFLPVRSPDLAGLFDTFAAARQAAEAWVDQHCRPPAEHRLAIVPAAFDDVLERHVLIYGVLEEHP